MAPDGGDQIDQLIQSNIDKLRKSGVLTVRPGYEIAGQQLTVVREKSGRKVKLKSTPAEKEGD